LKTLVECGFDADVAAVALAEHNNEVNLALDYLLSQSMKLPSQNTRGSLLPVSDSSASLNQVDVTSSIDDNREKRAQSVTVDDL
jgi:hypothetical protein